MKKKIYAFLNKCTHIFHWGGPQYNSPVCEMPHLLTKTFKQIANMLKHKRKIVFFYDQPNCVMDYRRP